MKTMTQYKTFEGGLLELNDELKKASQDGRKPILITSESHTEGEKLKKRITRYTVIFEKTVLEGS
jgi:hypothetical protein